MALECTYVDENTGISIDKAYVKVRHISGDVEEMSFVLDVWADKDKSDTMKLPDMGDTEDNWKQPIKRYDPVVTLHGVFKPDMKSKKNFFQQAYEIAKKQGFVKDAADV